MAIFSPGLVMMRSEEAAGSALVFAIEDIALDAFAAFERHGHVAAVIECLLNAFRQLPAHGNFRAFQRGPGSDGVNLDQRGFRLFRQPSGAPLPDRDTVRTSWREPQQRHL